MNIYHSFFCQPALFFDYGEFYTQEDTVRGYQKHKQVSILSQPGFVDITSDVDFGACESVAVESGVRVETPVTQGEFLVRMGAVERVERLISDEKTTDDEAHHILESFKRIVDISDMGGKFKVLGVSSIDEHAENCSGDDTFTMPGFIAKINES